jgi:site-specific recombinase XerC
MTRSVFTYAGRPIWQVNTKHWRAALKRAGITDFRWHDLRHTWASRLRQNDVPTWVLQELGGWKSEAMVRRYAHMSTKHLQPYADQLIFEAKSGHTAPSAQIPCQAPKVVTVQAVSSSGSSPRPI